MSDDNPNWLSEILERLIPIEHCFGSRAREVLWHHYKEEALDELKLALDCGGPTDDRISEILDGLKGFVKEVEDQVYPIQKQWYEEQKEYGRPKEPNPNDDIYAPDPDSPFIPDYECDMAEYKRAAKVYDHFAALDTDNAGNA